MAPNSKEAVPASSDDIMAPKSATKGVAPPQQVGSTMPGLWKYPTNRDVAVKSDMTWMAGKRADDGAEGIWRIHDTLYDFKDFVKRHPGGSEWLEMTKGTDITEAFEASHISTLPKQLLSKFEVKPAQTLRNSPYTFRADGFYATLRKRVFAVLPKAEMRGPSVPSRIVVDSLVVSMFTAAISAAVWQSLPLAMLAGVLLFMSTSAAHNFCHLKFNFRRFYFHLSLLSTRHWVVIHALSHHLYPNSVQDLEISMMEPYLKYLPRGDKTRWRHLSWIVSLFMYSSNFIFDYLRMLAENGPSLPDFIPLLVPAAMVGANQLALVAPASVGATLLLWLAVIVTGSFTFTANGLNACHHHPDIFHDGDAAREDRDWGLAQLDCVRDRTSVCGVVGTNTKDTEGRLVVHIDSSGSTSWFKFCFSMISFGHHTLHHLFPTVDLYRLPQLYPILEKTLTEFGIPFETSSITECVKGQFLLLVKNEPNPVPPGAKEQ